MMYWNFGRWLRAPARAHAHASPPGRTTRGSIAFPRERVPHLIAWLVVLALVVGVNVVSIPSGYEAAINLKDFPPEERDAVRRALDAVHLSPTHLAWYWIVVGTCTSLIFLVMSWLLVRRGQPAGFATYLAIVMTALGGASEPTGIADAYPGRPVLQALILVLTAIAVSGFFVLPLIFPNGHFVPRWTILVGVYLAVSFALLGKDSGFEGSMFIEVVSTVLLIGILIGAPIYRYRQVSTPEQRRQTRWVMLGFVIGIPAFFIGDTMMRNIDSSPRGMFFMLGFMVFIQIGFNIPFLAVGASMLFQNLFDIDVVLSRTLIWLSMTIVVIGTYIGIVVGLGTLIGSDDSLLLSLVATGLVAIAFQPIRDRIQRMIGRTLFGDRDDPYAVLSRLGHSIDDALSPADLLPQIIRTTAESLRLPYAALFLDQPDGPVLVAASGTAPASTVQFPLTYQGISVGRLDVATRSPGDIFTDADKRLLSDLARQIGIAARTVSLAEELQRSRERIVISREEERRRLRRDLHDGLGAQLAALIMEAGNARRSIRKDPDAADRALQELQAELRGGIMDIRRLVLGLRPPALDEIGLAGALRARLARLDGGNDDAESSLKVIFDAEERLPALPAATEVAAFRIVEEAVTNAVRHSHGSSVTVDIRLRDAWLVLTVTDNGDGFAASRDVSGLGLQSMRERASELGGTCSVETAPSGRGIEVRVMLPVQPRNDIQKQENHGHASHPDR